MSETQARRLSLGEVAALVPRGGEFTAENRYAPARGLEFTPWSRATFRPVAPPPEPEPEPEAAAEEPPAEEVAAQPELEPPPVPPEQETPPAPAEILAAIETAREDGRALGYQQGRDAAQKELGDALTHLRKLESEILSLAEGAYERNAEIMARHVRRIAQDLFGAVFADMPQTFVERIKNAADMFTKAGSDFTLALHPHDRLVLGQALGEAEIFQTIRIVEDDDLSPGAFRLASRDLAFDDAPLLDGEA